MELDTFVSRCREAAAGPSDEALPEIRRLVEELVADHERLAAECPAPTNCLAVSGASVELFEDDTVSIMLVHTPPHVLQPPHDHRMPVVIGGYAGVEAQRLFRRTDGGDTPIEPSGTLDLGPGDVMTLGSRGIHAISAGGDVWASGVHVYLGRLASVERSLFDPDTFAEQPLDLKVYDSLCKTS